MSIEAMKKAYRLLMTEPHAPTVCDKVETILRQAIAEAEQKPLLLSQKHLEGYWCADLTCKKCYSADFRFKHTHPPKREWVGLTPADMEELSSAWWKPNENEMALIDWIEAKLKQKNGYEEKNT